MLTRTEELFFELLRIALGTQETLTTTLTDNEWLEVSQMAVKQSVLGILYSAVEKLPEAQRPPTDLYIDMYQCVQEIEDRNRHLNKMTALVSSRFRKDGFPNCILKGQGIALLYPNPLRRQSGDIDIWLKGERKEIVKYVRKITKTKEMGYHHVGFNLKNGTSVEAHFCPSYAFNPFVNYRLQQWFNEQQKEQISNYKFFPDIEKQTPVPTLFFNVVFILHHIYRHFFNDGIGIRQLIDYFYVLKSYHDLEHVPSKNFTELFRSFGLSKFSTAIMWIMHEYLGLKAEFLVDNCNNKEGERVLMEILLTGNMGNGDPEGGKNRKERIIHRYKRLASYIVSYPSEVLMRHPFLFVDNIRQKLL